MHLDELKRQVFFEQVQRRSGGAVASVHNDLQRRQSRRVDKTQQLVDVLVRYIDVSLFTLRLTDSPLIAFRDLADILKTRIAANGPRLRAHHFQAVVVCGIVAGGDHDATVGAELTRAEVNHLGAADADVEHVAAGVDQAPGNGSRQFVARVSNVAAQNDAFRIEELCRRIADAVGDILVELIRDAPADVIGFETVDRDALVFLAQSSSMSRRKPMAQVSTSPVSYSPISAKPRTISQLRPTPKNAPVSNSSVLRSTVA